MSFSNQYAVLFGLAGFASAAYHIKVGKRAQQIPVIGFAVCVLYTFANYNIAYAFLTAIEYAVGFGLAHYVIKDKPKQDEEN